MLTGCATTRVTLPPRSATEQLLLSEASDAAALALQLKLPEGSRAYLDAANFEGLDSKYAISAIRQSLLQQGNALMEKREDADIVIEVRSGALSLDSISQMIGIPTVAIPQLGLNLKGANILTRSKTVAIAKFGLFAYDRHTGKIIAVVAPVMGFSHRSQDSANIVTWTQTRPTP